MKEPAASKEKEGIQFVLTSNDNYYSARKCPINA